MFDEPTNEIRAAWAFGAIDAFANLTRMRATGDNNETILGDLLADLMHYCMLNSMDFSKHLGAATATFWEEVAEEGDEIPSWSTGQAEFCEEVIRRAQSLHDLNIASFDAKEHERESASADFMHKRSIGEIGSIMMQDVVGEYETPDTVPEWCWVQRAASFCHCKNGVDGIWEFVFNLSLEFHNIPERLIPVMEEAKFKELSYLVFHQGT